MHVVSIHAPAPPNRQEIGSPARVLAAAAEELGASFQSFTLDSWQHAAGVWRHLGGGDDVTVIVLTGHGLSKRRPGQETPRNLILTADTDASDISDTSVDLDALVRALPPRPRGCLLVVDACAVDVNTSLGPSASVAVLVASPGGDAEARAEGPLLSLALVRELTTGRRDGRTLRSVVEATRTRVQQETSGRQRPALRLLGDSGFLDAPSPVAAPARTDARLARRLAELVGLDALPEPVMDALQGVVGASPGEAGLADLALSLQARRLFPHPTAQAANELKTALERSEDAPPSVRAAGLHWLGWAQVQLGRTSTALGHLEEAAALAEGGGHTRLASQIHNTLATASREYGSFSKANPHYERSFALKEQLGDTKGMEMTRAARAWLLCAQGRFEEADAAFDDGVRTCLGSLSRQQPGYDAPARLAAMESLFFHVVGRCVTLLLVGADSHAFRRLKADIQPWMQVYRPFHAWGGIGPMEEAILLLCLGANDKPPARPTSDHAPSAAWYATWWSAIRAAHAQGVSRLGDVEALLPLDPPRGEHLPARMKQLAGLHLLCRDLVGDAPPKLRDRFIERLRSTDNLIGIPQPNAPPWVTTARALTLDTTGWSGLGPLGGQLAEIARPNTLITPTATEHHLQLLAWTTLLVLALHGRMTWHDVAAHLAAVTGAGDLHLTLGSALQACRRIAQVVSVDERSSVAKLAASWCTDDCPRQFGYDGWGPIAAERNKAAHREQHTVEAANRLLARQSDLLRALSAGLDAADVRLAPGSPVSEQGLCPVQLSTSLGDRGPALDCGPLLLCAAIDHQAYYVPHRIEHSLLVGDAEGGAVYVRYAAAPTPSPSDANLRWPARPRLSRN